MDSSRKLVAIFFADIAGYTAMMQADEGKAMSRVGKFRNALTKEVNDHQGTLVQNYGDGALCIFDSVLGAIEAARSLQQELQLDPVVPVRIGIHLGDVIFKDDDIYGDAINVTSRIESMGVPGSVLISDDIFQKVRNRRELQFTSLGKYHFKNISKPIEVHACSNTGLKVPQKQEIQGKFAEKKAIKPWIKWVAAILLLLSVAVVYWQLPRDSDSKTMALGSMSESSIPSIAVLPFRNISSKEESTFLGEGIMEDLLSKLSKIKAINVISRTSSMKFKDSKMTIPEIAEELGADYYVEGSVQKEGNRVQIRTQLIDGQGDTPMWSSTYNEEIEDIFEVQGKVSLRIAQTLLATIRPETESTLLSVPTKDFDAWESYVKSIDLVASRSPTGLSEGIVLLTNAINLDPDFSEAYALLAEAYLMKGYIYEKRLENYQLAKKTAEKAINVNANNGRAYAILGNLHQYNGEWVEAKRDFEKAIGFSPNDATVNKWYSLVFSNTNQVEKAITLTRKAKQIEPLSINSNLFHVQALLIGRKTEEARNLLLLAKEQFPENWQVGWMMARSYLTDQDYEKAIELYLENPNKDSPFLKSELAFCYARIDQKDKAWALFEGISRDDPKYDFFATHIYAGLNELEQAFLHLDAIVQQDIYDALVFLIKAEGDPLREDPRYWDYMQRLGLKEYWEQTGSEI